MVTPREPMGGGLPPFPPCENHCTQGSCRMCAGLRQVLDGCTDQADFGPATTPSEFQHLVAVSNHHNLSLSPPHTQRLYVYTEALGEGRGCTVSVAARQPRHVPVSDGHVVFIREAVGMKPVLVHFKPHMTIREIAMAAGVRPLFYDRLGFCLYFFPQLVGPHPNPEAVSPGQDIDIVVLSESSKWTDVCHLVPAGAVLEVCPNVHLLAAVGAVYANLHEIDAEMMREPLDKIRLALHWHTLLKEPASAEKYIPWKLSRGRESIDRLREAMRKPRPDFSAVLSKVEHFLASSLDSLSLFVLRNERSQDVIGDFALMYASPRTAAGARDFNLFTKVSLKEYFPPVLVRAFEIVPGQSSTGHTPRRAVRSDRDQVFSANTTEVTNGNDLTMDAPSTPPTQLFEASRPSWMRGPRRPRPNNQIETPQPNFNPSSLQIPNQPPPGPMANPLTAVGPRSELRAAAAATARNFSPTVPSNPPQANHSPVPVGPTDRNFDPTWFTKRITALRADVSQFASGVKRRVEDNMTGKAGPKPKFYTAKEQTRWRHYLMLMEYISFERPLPPLTPSNFARQLQQHTTKVIKSAASFAQTRGEPLNWPRSEAERQAWLCRLEELRAQHSRIYRQKQDAIPDIARITTKAVRKRGNQVFFNAQKAESVYSMELLLLLLWEEQENEMKNTRKSPLRQAPTQPVVRSPALPDTSQQQPLQISDSDSENGAKDMGTSENAAEGHGDAVREDGSSRPENRFSSRPVTPTPATPAVDDVGMAETVDQSDVWDTSNEPIWAGAGSGQNEPNRTETGQAALRDGGDGGKVGGVIGADLEGSRRGGNDENASFQISVNLDAGMVQVQEGVAAHHSDLTEISGGESQSQPAPVTSRPSSPQGQQTRDQSTPQQQPEFSTIPENEVQIPLPQSAHLPEAPLLFSRSPAKENNMSERIQSTFRTVRKQKQPRKQNHAPGTLYREGVPVLHMQLRPGRVNKAKSKSKSQPQAKSKLQSQSRARATINPVKSDKSKQQPIAKHTNNNSINHANSGGQNQQQQQQQGIQQEPPRSPTDAPRSTPPDDCFTQFPALEVLMQKPTFPKAIKELCQKVHPIVVPALFALSVVCGHTLKQSVSAVPLFLNGSSERMSWMHVAHKSLGPLDTWPGPDVSAKDKKLNERLVSNFQRTLVYKRILSMVKNKGALPNIFREMSPAPLLNPNAHAVLSCVGLGHSNVTGSGCIVPPDTKRFAPTAAVEPDDGVGPPIPCSYLGTLENRAGHIRAELYWVGSGRNDPKVLREALSLVAAHCRHRRTVAANGDGTVPLQVVIVTGISDQPINPTTLLMCARAGIRLVRTQSAVNTVSFIALLADFLGRTEHYILRLQTREQDDETRPETQPNERPETDPETQPETGPETRSETRPTTRPQTQPNTRPETTDTACSGDAIERILGDPFFEAAGNNTFERDEVQLARLRKNSVIEIQYPASPGTYLRTPLERIYLAAVLLARCPGTYFIQTGGYTFLLDPPIGDEEGGSFLEVVRDSWNVARGEGHGRAIPRAGWVGVNESEESGAVWTNQEEDVAVGANQNEPTEDTAMETTNEQGPEGEVAANQIQPEPAADQPQASTLAAPSITDQPHADQPMTAQEGQHPDAHASANQSEPPLPSQSSLPTNQTPDEGTPRTKNKRKRPPPFKRGIKQPREARREHHAAVMEERRKNATEGASGIIGQLERSEARSDEITRLEAQSNEIPRSETESHEIAGSEMQVDETEVSPDDEGQSMQTEAGQVAVGDLDQSERGDDVDRLDEGSGIGDWGERDSQLEKMEIAGVGESVVAQRETGSQSVGLFHVGQWKARMEGAGVRFDVGMVGEPIRCKRRVDEAWGLYEREVQRENPVYMQHRWLRMRIDWASVSENGCENTGMSSARDRERDLELSSHDGWRGLGEAGRVELVGRADRDEIRERGGLCKCANCRRGGTVDTPVVVGEKGGGGGWGSQSVE